MLLLAALVFTGSNWIATGYCPTARDRIECEITVDAVQANASAAVFGTTYAERPGDESHCCAFYVKTDGDDATTLAYGGSASGMPFTTGVRTTLTVDPSGATWEAEGGGSGWLPLVGASPAGTLTPLVIGNVNVAEQIGETVPGDAGIGMTLHRVRIWYGGLELVHDYVPTNCQGKAGVYDEIDKRFLLLQGGVAPEPEPPVITSIAVDREEDHVCVDFTTQPGFTYVLLRSPTVASRSSYTTEVARAVADAATLTLTDETPDRPKSQAFYIVEAR